MGPKKAVDCAPSSSNLPQEARGQDAIYSLPPGLTMALQKGSGHGQARFFTPEEEAVELAFAEEYGNGVFLGNGFVYPLFSILPQRNQSKKQRALDQQMALIDEQLRCMMEEEMSSGGRSTAEIDEYFSSKGAIEELVNVRRAAYAGWLVTNPEFHVAVQDFRRNAAHSISRDGELPTLPKTFFGFPIDSIPKRRREFLVDYSMLYRSWSIDGLLTWDLPIPMEPQLDGTGSYDLNQADPAGVTLFLPWYLLRDKQLTIESPRIVQKTYALPNHLRSWLDGLPKNLGIHRYAVLLRLYACLELALEHGAMDRNRGTTWRSFDRAGLLRICTVMRSRAPSESAVDSVRKLRQIMSRRLRATKNPFRKTRETNSNSCPAQVYPDTQDRNGVCNWQLRPVPSKEASGQIDILQDSSVGYPIRSAVAGGAARVHRRSPEKPALCGVRACVLCSVLN